MNREAISAQWALFCRQNQQFLSGLMTGLPEARERWQSVTSPARQALVLQSFDRRMQFSIVMLTLSYEIYWECLRNYRQYGNIYEMAHLFNLLCYQNNERFLQSLIQEMAQIGFIPQLIWPQVQQNIAPARSQFLAITGTDTPLIVEVEETNNDENDSVEVAEPLVTDPPNHVDVQTVTQTSTIRKSSRIGEIAASKKSMNQATKKVPKVRRSGRIKKMAAAAQRIAKKQTKASRRPK